MSDERTITAVDDRVEIRVVPWDLGMVEKMQRLGLARYWDPATKAYVVPEERFTEAHLAELQHDGFEVVG